MKMYYFLLLYKCKDFHMDYKDQFKNIKYFDNIDIDASRDFLSGALRREVFIGFVKAEPLADDDVWRIADNPLVISKVSVKVCLCCPCLTCQGIAIDIGIDCRSV